MIITCVEELLDCFTFLPERIVYFDKTNNVEDTVVIKITKEQYDEDAYQSFLEEYGGYEVDDFSFNHENTLYIDIESPWGEEGEEEE